MSKLKLFLIFFLFSLNFKLILPVNASNLEMGKILFNSNCLACHNNGNNLIIPEKNLKKPILEANGMYTKEAIMYQILNGKNGMPAFGGRLSEIEIEEIAEYVLFASEKNFEI